MIVDKQPYVIYDAGTEVYDGTMPFCSLLKKLQDELDKGEAIVCVVSLACRSL